MYNESQHLSVLKSNAHSSPTHNGRRSAGGMAGDQRALTFVPLKSKYLNAPKYV
jgi:hypothetical protein